MPGDGREDMKRELDGYRRALRYLGGTCDWSAFHAKAAQLFEYLETAGMASLKRRIEVATASVVIALVAAFAVFGSLGSAGVPFFAEHRETAAAVMVTLYAAAILVLLELRLYLSVLSARRQKREAEFVTAVEEAARVALGPDACSMPGR